ncbi:hypothetical protein J6590_010957 [Homalodisca vitripennis]|nr:hypothetical protein J6590_010957 [Homalodisca vitripennis]
MVFQVSEWSPCALPQQRTKPQPPCRFHHDANTQHGSEYLSGNIPVTSCLMILLYGICLSISKVNSGVYHEILPSCRENLPICARQISMN